MRLLTIIDDILNYCLIIISKGLAMKFVFFRVVLFLCINLYQNIIDIISLVRFLVFF